MPHSKDNGAQSNFDFLVGVSVFLVGFLYVLTFVPGLFISYQPGAVDLSSVAYKTCAVLVEDPGWYTYASGDGNPDWETQVDYSLLDISLAKIDRFGLATDRQSPNVISVDKVNKLQRINDTGKYDNIREKIGLAGSINYNFSMDLEMTNTMTDSVTTILDISSAYPSDNMEKMQRYVMVDTGKQLFINCQNPEDVTAKSKVLRVSLAGIPSSNDQDLTIRIYNAEYDWTINTVRGDETSFPMNELFYQMDYIIRINGVEQPNGPMPGTPVQINKNDIVEIVFHYETISMNDISYLLIGESDASNAVFPGNEIGYVNDPLYRRQSVCYPGTFTLEVWSDELW